MNKRFYFSGLAGLCLAILVSACKHNDDVDPQDAQEFKHIRVLVTDEKTTDVSLINPRTGEVLMQQARFPMAATYTMQSGRYGVLVHRADNLVQAFDTGLENHGDHVDVKGTPKWAAIASDGKLPTHFKSKGNEMIIFNDGDGTLDIAQEADFHTTGAKMTRINAGNAAHHGAMTKFDNGLYAITEKDGSVAGTLPERVKVIDAGGKQVYASTVQTKGIHGNASDGKVALFGSSGGILVVDANGSQRLIAHPADFGTAWFGTILEGNGVFVGYTAAMGAYLIDVTNSKVTPVVANKDIMQCKVDYSGNQLVVLLHSGEVQVYELKSNKLLRSANVIAATDKAETQKPQLEATSKYLYITQPKTGQILQVETANLTSKKTIKVSATPYRLSVVGVESNADH